MEYVQDENEDAARDEGIVRFGVEFYTVTWIKFSLSVMCICGVLSASLTCSKEEHDLGEEFSLGIGETASLKGEQLRVQFLEISEDSRCPRNVQCIWEGRAVAVIEVFIGDTSQKIELVEQGLTDTGAKEQSGEYEFVFRILPYPEEAEVQISQDEYRLMLTVNKN